MTHLSALKTRLSNERVRLAESKNPQETALRTVWISQIEKEIAQEELFLGEDVTDSVDDFLSDEELLASLFS